MVESQENNKAKFKKFLNFLAPQKDLSKRIWELDFIRGFCIILMLWDHLMVMIYTEFSFAWCDAIWSIDHFVYSGNKFLVWICTLAQSYEGGSLRYYGHIIVLFLFFSICGISCSFSRSNLKRGIVLAIVSTLWSVGSYIGEYVLEMGPIFVHFGVLSLLATCILLYCFINFICFKNKVATMAISGAIVIVTLCLYHLYKPDNPFDGIFNFIFESGGTYGMDITFEHHFNTLTSFSPGDLFTFVPWSAFFFFGTFIQPYLYSERKSFFPKLNGRWTKAFCFIGRHGLLIYITHILIIALILMLISACFITPGNFVLF